MDRFLLATDEGVIAVTREEEGWRTGLRLLEDHHVTSVSTGWGVALAGTHEGLFRSEDDGTTWDPVDGDVTEPHLRWLLQHPEVEGLAFAGTEPAQIFVSRDGARTWQASPEVARLRDANGWYLPYSPESGCVRGFAVHGARAYAAVEQGGLLRSDDRGAGWAPVEGCDPDPRAERPSHYVHPDVHSVAVHPTAPDRVLAPTGGGLYRSEDGGRTWAHLYDCYCRAAWWDPEDPDHIVFGPADGVDIAGRIEESTDGGESWDLASANLDVPWRESMVERFVPTGEELWAVLSNGHLLAAPLSRLTWRRLLPDIEGIEAVAIV
jgi:hypothetical protein